MPPKVRRCGLHPLCWALLWLPLLVLGPCPANATVEARDAEGRLVRLPQPATRIVALAPHIVENLFAIGAGDAIVGTVQFSDYPESARQIPRVGGVGSMSLETIVALDPDLVLVWGSGTPSGLRAAMERLGISYFVDEIRSLDELGNSFLALGSLTGHSMDAAKVRAGLDESLASLRAGAAASGGDKMPGVFLQVWDQPLQSIGKEHLLNEVIQGCGGRSITDTALGLAPLMSMERVLADDPAVIVVDSPEQARHWEQYPTMRATRTHNVAVINPDLLHRPTLRLLEGMQLICRRIEASQAAQ
ncbi:MAG: helical backbone metal receptor [Congregibacter sp.]|nr:helical backbone metal receptor [Congregibacter sp.]